jgi:hypothetical protein
MFCSGGLSVRFAARARFVQPQGDASAARRGTVARMSGAPYAEAQGGFGMKITTLRRNLYLLARVLGDVQALKSPRKGAVTRRIGRRIAGKATGRMLGRIFR